HLPPPTARYTLSLHDALPIFIDIGGGFVLAGYCFYFFRDSAATLPVTKNQRVGFYYSAAAVFLFAFAPICWPLSALLFWPSLSLDRKSTRLNSSHRTISYAVF